jgi:hypothetical protein
MTNTAGVHSTVADVLCAAETDPARGIHDGVRQCDLTIEPASPPTAMSQSRTRHNAGPTPVQRFSCCHKNGPAKDATG